MSTQGAYAAGVTRPDSLPLGALRRHVARTILLAGALATSALAQDARGALATRAGLTANAEAAAQAGRADEATMIRRRLADGDFAVGDRVVFTLRGDTTYRDTLAVQQGRVLRIPNLPDISLAGVLRSEVQQYLTTQLARYYRAPLLEAQPLVRVAVFGEVGRPGFYWTTADVLLSDAIMSAGGPTSNADVTRTMVRREGKPLLDADAVRQAIARGATIDELSFHAGDEIVVAKKKERNILQNTGLIIGLIASIVSATALLSRSK